jgi:peptide/nickel transport system substrate-binding protein
VPILAAEIPTARTAASSADGMSVTWKLKRASSGTTASPSPPTTCVFNWEYATIPRPRRAVTIGTYKDIKVEKVDAHGARQFKKPTPFWADAFVGTRA